MTPLLIFFFGISPTTRDRHQDFYAAVTKTVGGWRHLRMKTVNMDLVKWLALGSVPSAVGGVVLVSWLQTRIGGLRLRRLNRSAHDTNADALKHLIEASREFAIAIPSQQATVKKSTASMPFACIWRNSRHDGPERLGAGPM